MARSHQELRQASRSGRSVGHSECPANSQIFVIPTEFQPERGANLPTPKPRWIVTNDDQSATGEKQGCSLTGASAGRAHQAEDLVLATITQHADALLRTARRHSLCADDASDAYQRALEIFLRNAARLDPARAVSWLHTVVKHEAMAVRQSRQRIVGAEEFDGDAIEAIHQPAPDERLLAFEDVTRAAEALQGLKPQELRALWLRMEGRTYKEIAERAGLDVHEGESLPDRGPPRLPRVATPGSRRARSARRWEPVLSALVDGEAGGDALAAVRRHLRGCAACRATLRALRQAAAGARRGAAGRPGRRRRRRGGLRAGFVMRVYETVVGNLQERAVAVAAKTQLVAEASGVVKVAAVAGAAAAVAGGGAVTVAEGTPERPAAPKPAVRVVAQQVPKAAVASAPVVVSMPTSSSAATRRTEKRATARESKGSTVEFTFEQQVRTTQPRQSSTASPPARAGGEFDLEP